MGGKIRRRVIISSDSESSSSKELKDSESSEEECELPSLLERLHRKHNLESSVLSQQLSSFKNKATNVDEKENIPSCSICFTAPAVVPSYPDCCNHTFCYDCLVTWSDMLNICPLCKRKFHFICDLFQSGKKTKVLDKKQPKYLEDDSYFNQVEDAVYCPICGTDTNEHVLLLCDGCNVGMHTYCLTPPLDEVPPGEWFCPECQESRQLQVTSVISEERVTARNRRRRRSTTRVSRTTRPHGQRRRRRRRRKSQSRRQTSNSTSIPRSRGGSQSFQDAAVISFNTVRPNIIPDENDESSSGYASDESFLNEVCPGPISTPFEHSSFCSGYSRTQTECSYPKIQPYNCLPRDILYRFGIGTARAIGCSRQVLGRIGPNFVPETPENKT